MTQFDAAYFNSIHLFINEQDDRVFLISELTEDREKFIFHLKYYMDNRGSEDLYIILDDNDTKLVILEFFSGKHFEKRKEANIKKFWDQLKREQSPFK